MNPSLGIAGGVEELSTTRKCNPVVAKVMVCSNDASANLNSCTTVLEYIQPSPCFERNSSSEITSYPVLYCWKRQGL